MAVPPGRSSAYQVTLRLISRSIDRIHAHLRASVQLQHRGPQAIPLHYPRYGTIILTSTRSAFYTQQQLSTTSASAAAANNTASSHAVAGINQYPRWYHTARRRDKPARSEPPATNGRAAPPQHRAQRAARGNTAHNNSQHDCSGLQGLQGISRYRCNGTQRVTVGLLRAARRPRGTPLHARGCMP